MQLLPKTMPQWIIGVRTDKKKECQSKAQEASAPSINKKPKKRKRKPAKAPKDSLKPTPRAIRFSQEHLANPTEAEVAFAEILSEYLQPFKLEFFSQHPISCFIADFYIPKKKLVIEVDGEYHFYNGQKDAKRTRRLAKLGLRVIRFTNNEVLTSPHTVRNQILKECIGNQATILP